MNNIYFKRKKLRLATMLAAGVLMASSAPANATDYTFKLLGETLRYSVATAINASGQVVGYAPGMSWHHGPSPDDEAFSYESSPSHAMVWSGSGVTDLGSLVGMTWDSRDQSRALAINASGQVAGESGGGMWSGNGVVWDRGTLRDLGSNSVANGINTSGQVVGTTNLNATLWSGASVTNLSALDGSYSQAFAINDSGHIVGSSSALNNTVTHATLWKGGSLTDLGTLGGTYSSANAINISGQVVGQSKITGDMAIHATLWDGSSVIDLGTLVGTFSDAKAINAAGLVVGASSISSIPNDNVATLWAKGSALDLNSLLDANTLSAGWVLKEATGINDKGWIVGNAHNTITGVDHGFLLTAVPLPKTYTMLLAGLGLMGFVLRRNNNQTA